MAKHQNEVFSKYHFCAFVSPYESDQQMAQMFYAGLVDYVISCDSDMVVYGVPTIRGWNNGKGDFIPYNTISRIAMS